MRLSRRRRSQVNEDGGGGAVRRILRDLTYSV
jgi:hypothetical protein